MSIGSHKFCWRKIGSDGSKVVHAYLHCSEKSFHFGEFSFNDLSLFSLWQGQWLFEDKHAHWQLGQCMWTTEPNRFPEVLGNEVFAIFTEALLKNNLPSAYFSRYFFILSLCCTSTDSNIPSTPTSLCSCTCCFLSVKHPSSPFSPSESPEGKLTPSQLSLLV